MNSTKSLGSLIILWIAALMLGACGGGGGGSGDDSAALTPALSNPQPPAPLTWFFSDGAALTDSQITSFNNQGLYFNAHSTANPGGEIRGQIVPSSPSFITDNGNPATSNTVSTLLTGDEEVPASTSKAIGYATIVLDPATKTIKGAVVTSGIVGTAAHIHLGLPGVAGPVVFPLTGGPTVWTVPDGTVLSDAQITNLTTGAYYVNVHSTANPGGEIRGQLNQQLRFAALSSANEVPANTSTASGIAVLALNPSTNLVHGFVKTTGITATAAHFHQAAAGTNGPVIVPLKETFAGSGIWAVPAAGQTLTAAQAAAFSANGLYANVHSAANPGGEIRGQVVAATVTIGNAALSGANEVPPVTSAATGTGVMALNSVTRQVQGNLGTDGIDATAAHVHAAAAGVNGPVIVPLTLTPPASTIQAPLAVSTASLPDGTVGTAYSQTLSASGGTAPYTWAVASGTLPAGLNLSSAGVLSGTPTAAANSSFSVSATDAATPAATTTKALTLNVSAAAAATISFSAQIQPIFDANCTTGCHMPGGISEFMNLTSGSAYASLVQSPQPRVIAGNSAASVIVARITGATLPQMPLGKTPLSAADQTRIKNWIDQGAANN